MADTVQEAKIEAEEGRGEMYGNFGTAAIILALCLGLGTCSLMDSIGKKYDAETAAIKKQIELKQ